MNRTLRHVARSPHLGMLAWLAWVFLAVMPAHGMPAGVMGAAPVVGQMALMTHPVDHAMPDMADDCCAKPFPGDYCTMQACHCVTTGDLPALIRVALAPAIIDALPVPRKGADAPSVTSSPPLRPPAFQISV
jgi:hypothetical protein